MSTEKFHLFLSLFASLFFCVDATSVINLCSMSSSCFSYFDLVQGSYITLFSKPMLQRLLSECSNQYKVNTYHYIDYQDYGCTLNSNYEKTCLNITYK